MPYDPAAIEPRWQAYWAENAHLPRRESIPARPKFYALDMFPYPSGAGLHVGHPEGYTATDILAATSACAASTCCTRWAGTASACQPNATPCAPASIPPSPPGATSTTFRGQIRRLGFSYDWSRELATTDPAYVRWTQWIFLQPP